MAMRERAPVRARAFGAGLAGVVVAIGGIGVANASGFALLEQGVKQMGTAYAGTAATVHDPSVIAYNPAGIGFLDGTQLSSSIIVVDVRSDFDGQGTFAITGAPVPGGDGGNAGGVVGIPALYLSHRLADNAAVGLGIYMPYGETTNYKNHWTGRYQAQLSKIFAINFNPVFAFKPTDNLSLGFGVIVQYFDAKLTNDIDAGTLGAEGSYQTQQALADQGLAPPPTQAQLQGALGAAQGQYDVHNELSGHDITYGFNAGILWEATPSTRIGLSYRSETTPHIDNGKVERTGFDQAGLAGALSPSFGAIGIGVAQAVGAQLSSVGGSTDAELPATVNLGIRQEVTSDLALLAGVQWIGWNRFDKLVIHYDDNRPSTVIDENYDNSYRFAGGAEYRVNDTWTVRGGLAYDESPVDGHTRDARVPDNDRLTLALGATLRATDQLTVDMGYQHVFVHDGSINETAPGGSGNTLQGEYHNAADLIGVQVNYKF